MKTKPEPAAQTGWGRTIEDGLGSAVIGHPIFSYDRVESTNDVLKDHAVHGAPEGTTVLARVQTKGRGRRGRTWSSCAGQGVYASVLLRPRIPATDAGWLALVGGVAVIRALELLEVQNLMLKWPNDVLVGNRKIAGILIEPRIGGGELEFAVVGIGVNVQQRAEDWPDVLKETATSCHMEGVSVSCDHVILAVLGELDSVYSLLRQQKTVQLMREWVKRGGTAEMPVIE